MSKEKSVYKVMFLSAEGKALKTKHVRAVDYADAERAAGERPEGTTRVQVRKKQQGWM